MNATTENLTAIGKAQVEAVLRFAEVAAQGVEKIAELNVKVAKAAFADGVKNAKSLSEIKDVSELSAWATGASQPGVEQASAYAKSLFETASATSTELGSLIEAQVGEFNKQVVVALDSALKSAPAGSESAVAAAKSVIGIANSVYDNIAKASKQLTAITEANVAAATTQAATATKKKAA
jgi:phasin family protein